MTTLGMKIMIVLEPQDEGGFVVHVPALQGCVTQGSNREEAISNIKEAIELYLEPSEHELSEHAGEKIELIM